MVGAGPSEEPQFLLLAAAGRDLHHPYMHGGSAPSRSKAKKQRQTYIKYSHLKFTTFLEETMKKQQKKLINNSL